MGQTWTRQEMSQECGLPTNRDFDLCGQTFETERKLEERILSAAVNKSLLLIVEAIKSKANKSHLYLLCRCLPITISFVYVLSEFLEGGKDP